MTSYVVYLSFRFTKNIIYTYIHRLSTLHCVDWVVVDNSFIEWVDWVVVEWVVVDMSFICRLDIHKI